MSPAIRSLIDPAAIGDGAAGAVAGAITTGGSEARAVPVGAGGAAAAAGGAILAAATEAGLAAGAAPGALPGSACGDSNWRGATMGGLAAIRGLSTRGGC